ncbi:phage integrase N-terminal SAM-like domain-containing protein [Roseiarcaceae bacterium H3SJ34-1]|uniref:phage integrase n=1 Tax=Terripilifer ovatus TaxID=3032367 RepID=UPI003AB99963|nr:phage integrase N-terminal SAM-like domain-containing protein [Roseiarcaceae bacterium H3SJ34-1]
MLFRLVRPMRRKDSRIPYFTQRIPADVKARATGLKLAIPVGAETVQIVVSAAARVIKVSLRTADPAEAKIRQATIAAYLESVWAALRQDAPLPLTFRQATALAGRLYRAWAEGEGRERTLAVEYSKETGKFERVGGSEDDEPAYWAAALAGLNETADDLGALERTFGPIIDHQLLKEGIRRVDANSRVLLLKAFASALRDAFEGRQRNAGGDYAPDTKAARFPDFESPAEPSRASAAKPTPRGKQSLTKLVEDWWAEAKIAGRSLSTYESYRNTVARLVTFLGHDDASRVTPEDVIRFKDHRLAQGVSTKTVADGDMPGLRSVFSWAVSNRRMASNPAVGIKVQAQRSARTRPKGFTDAEARAILSHASGYVRPRQESAKVAAAKRWVPWLCAYTGARLGEMVQLRKEDLTQRGHWVLNITPEAGTVKDKESREVVLHAHLIEQGFLDFVSQSPPGYLFISVSQDAGMRGVWRSVKNRVTEFVREVMTDPRIRPNHGWRHTFKTIGREVGIADSVLDGICGHVPASVGGDYGDVSIAAQVKAFERFPRFEIDGRGP